MQLLDPEAVFRTVDLTGVFVNAVLGGAIARSLKLDIIGFLVLAVLSGLGGGMIRDALLQDGRPVALSDPAYLITALVGTGLVFNLPIKGRWMHRGLTAADSLALGCWAATGASKGLAAGLGWIPAIMLGMITAVGGGAVRDVCVGRVPGIFGGNTLTATTAFVSALTMAAAWELGRPNWGMAAAILLAALLTALTRRLGWTLPGQGGWDVGSAGLQLARTASAKRPRIVVHKGKLGRQRSERNEQARTGTIPIIQIERDDSPSAGSGDDAED